jgi:hypothetical protein
MRTASPLTRLLPAWIAGILLFGPTPTIAHADVRSHAPANAAVRPKLNLALTSSNGDAGVPTAYSWTAQDVHGGTLVLQRQAGTASQWRTISRLQGSSGDGKIPALPLGSYRLRIANFGPKPKFKLLAEQRRRLYVFGKVLLADLTGGPVGAGVYTMPTGTFSYVRTAIAYFGGLGETAFTIRTNNCRSVHLDFAVEPQTDYQQGGGTLGIVQEADDPVSASTPMATPGSLDARLMPGHSWSATVATDLRGGAYVHLNGSASCYSAASGVPQGLTGVQP